MPQVTTETRALFHFILYLCGRGGQPKQSHTEESNWWCYNHCCSFHSRSISSSSSSGSQAPPPPLDGISTRAALHSRSASVCAQDGTNKRTLHNIFQPFPLFSTHPLQNPHCIWYCLWDLDPPPLIFPTKCVRFYKWWPFVHTFPGLFYLSYEYFCAV